MNNSGDNVFQRRAGRAGGGGPRKPVPPRPRLQHLIPVGHCGSTYESSPTGSLHRTEERFVVGRVTTRDVADFRDHLRRDRQQAVASVNRCLVSLRKFFGWLVSEGSVALNPAKPVKELRRQMLAPKGLDRTQVRRLLREVELRGDVRANAVFHLLLYTGWRVSDLDSS